jgi:hypothetical protein
VADDVLPIDGVVIGYDNDRIVSTNGGRRYVL